MADAKASDDDYVIVDHETVNLETVEPQVDSNKTEEEAEKKADAAQQEKEAEEAASKKVSLRRTFL